jgi:hypothetical protein
MDEFLRRKKTKDQKGNQSTNAVQSIAPADGNQSHLVY